MPGNVPKQQSNKKALIMAGGTGGHVIPGLEIADSLINNGYEVAWLGTKAGLESDLVPKHNIKIFYLPVWGVRGKRLISKLLAPFRVFLSIIYSFIVLIKFKPDFVLGMGGFASGPGGVAAWLRGVPLIIHEQNAIFGLTNAILQRFSSKVLVSFPDCVNDTNNLNKSKDKAGNVNPMKSIGIKNIDAEQIIYTGNPVRKEICELSDPKERWQQRVGSLRVLVLGGSRGAMALNTTVPQAIAKLPVSQRPEIWHQAGKANIEQTENEYNRLGLKVKVEPFISDMAKAYEWADLVIARAGALTVSELAAAGTAALLIPYPYATDDHQRLNANYLVKNNAALMLEQKDLNVEVLSDLLLKLINSRRDLLDMAVRARELSKQDATHNIIKHCQEVALNATH